MLTGVGRFLLLLAGLTAVGLFSSPAQVQAQARTEAGAWREFQGTWTAVGRRHVVELGAGRQAAIADFEGSLMLSGSLRPEVGFRAEAVVLTDSVTGMVGRAVWTDDRGDRVYSELHGQSGAAGKRIDGTFIGGTGRYAGATGNYEFSWRFLIEGEEGEVQGQSVGLKGRVRATEEPRQ